MKQEARFQIRGEVTGLLDETYKESVRVSMVLRVAVGQDKNAWFKVAVWGDELCRVARACKGRQVLVVGRLSGGQSQAGYYNTYLSADAILVEPAAAAPSAPRRDKPATQSAPQQPQADDPLPWEENMANADIPF